MKLVSDPEVLSQLNAAPKPVTDPAILEQLNSESPVVHPGFEMTTDPMGNPIGGLPAQTTGATQEDMDFIKQEAGKFAIPPEQAAQKASEGIPVLGPYLDKAKAGVDAAATGIGNQFGLTSPFSNAPDFSQRYAENLAKTQAQSKQTQAQYPYGSNIAKVAGNAAVMGPLVAGAPAAFGAGEGPLIGRTLIGAGTGGAIGGADAAVKGEDIGTGAMIGAGTGAAAPVLGGAIGAVAKQLTPADTGLLSGVNPMAVKWAKRALISDGATPESVESAFNRMGPQAFLAEFGPNTKGLTSAAAGMPGSGKAEIIQGFETRAAQESGVINKSLDNAFGPSTNVPKYVDFLEKQRKSAADPLYEAFRNTEIPMTPQLEGVLSRPSVKEAMPAAARLAEDEGRPIMNSAGHPTAETYDYIKRALDDKARAAGFGTNQARVLTGLKRELTSAIDNHPDPNVAGVWKQARQEYSDRSSILDALEQGQNWRKIHKDELPSVIEGYSGPEKSAFMQGMRSDIADIAESTKRGDTTSRNLFLAPANQEKAATLIGQDKANELVQAMANSADRSANRSLVIGNSQTQPRQEMGKMLTPNPEDTLMARVRSKYSPHVTPGGLIPKSLEEAATARQAAQFEEGRNALAKILMQQGPEAQNHALALLNQKEPGQAGKLASIYAAILSQQASPLARGSISAPFVQ